MLQAAGPADEGTALRRDTGRQPDLEAARIVAVLAVFAVHYPLAGGETLGGAVSAFSAPWLDLGEWGVAVFVTISGATLGLAYAAPGGGDWLALGGRRWAGLMLPYWFVAAPILALAGFAGRMALSDAWMIPLWLLGLGFVTPESYLPPISAWWYVGLAWQIIVAVPLMVALLRRAGLVWTLFVVISASMVALAYLPHGEAGYSERTLVVCRLLEVLGGCLAAALLWEPARRGMGLRSAIGAATAFAVCVAAEASLTFVADGGFPLSRAAGMLCLLVLAAATPIGRWGSVGVRNALVRNGRLTYAFFLTHLIVIAVFPRISMATLPAVLALCFLTAWGTDAAFRAVSTAARGVRRARDDAQG